MNRALMIALMVVSAGTAGLVRAQPVPGGAVGASAETLLHLSAEGAVQAAPDQLVAALLAQATAASAAEAQRRANALVAQGLQAARSVPAVEARAIGYGVSPADEKRTQWTAQQTLELRGGDGPALLDLTNRLQQLGFVTEVSGLATFAGIAAQCLSGGDDGGVEGAPGAGGVRGRDAGIEGGSYQGRAVIAGGGAAVPADDGDGGPG